MMLRPRRIYRRTARGRDCWQTRGTPENAQGNALRDGTFIAGIFPPRQRLASFPRASGWHLSSAPKAPNVTAQGNALWKGAFIIRQPQRGGIASHDSVQSVPHISFVIFDPVFL